MDTFTIGQLARKTGLTRRALRLYEESGLLVPERGEHNQYRYYTHGQLQDALVIKMLRESGLPLKSIHRLFELKRSDLPVEEKLAQSGALLDGLHKELSSKQRSIEVAINQIAADREAIRQLLEERLS